jgi:hypothetical protein
VQYVLVKRKVDGPSIPELGTPVALTFDSVRVPLNRPSTGPNPVSAYQLERSTDGSTWAVIATGASIFGNPPAQYVDGGRAAATTYYYRARTTDTAGRVSAYCATVSVATPAGAGGGIVTASATVTGVNTAGVTVTVNPPPGLTVIDYAVRRSVNGGAFSAITWTPTNWHDDLLAPYPYPTAPATRTVNRGIPVGGINYHTITAALNAMVNNANEHVVVWPGIYNEFVRVEKSGFTIRAFDYNDPPVIDGSGLAGFTWNGTLGSAALVALQGANIWWDRILIRNSQGRLLQFGECRNNGFFTGFTSTRYPNIKILRSEISDCTGGQAVVAQNIVDAVFAGNKCFRMGSNTYSNFNIRFPGAVGEPNNVLIGSCWGLKMLGNEFAQGSGEGVAFGLFNDTATNNVVCYDVEFIGNRVFDTFSNLMYANNMRRAVFERNLFYKTNDYTFWDERNSNSGNPKKGFEIGNEMNNPDLLGGGVAYGYAPDGISGLRDVVIRNNVFTGVVSPFLGGGYAGATIDRITIENNTFFSLQTGNAWYYDNEASALHFSFRADRGESISGITCRNNIIDVGTSQQTIRPYSGVTGSNIWRSNLWSHLPRGEVRGSGDIIGPTGLTNRSYIRSVRPLILDGVGERPAYDTKAFEIARSSPALNSGEGISGVTRDFFGQLRPTESGRLDRGAHSLSKPTSLALQDTVSTSGSVRYQVDVTFSDGTGASSAIADAR